MNRTDFTYLATPYGFTLHYKGKAIGSIIAKSRRGPLERSVKADQAFYQEVARHEIKQLLMGAGRFVEQVKEIV